VVIPATPASAYPAPLPLAADRTDRSDHDTLVRIELDTLDDGLLDTQKTSP
jgi:hypothetical protein